MNKVVMGSSPAAVTKISDFASALTNEFLDSQGTIECGFTLKRVRDMIRTYRHRTQSVIRINYNNWV